MFHLHAAYLVVPFKAPNPRFLQSVFVKQDTNFQATILDAS